MTCGAAPMIKERGFGIALYLLFTFSLVFFPSPCRLSRIDIRMRKATDAALCNDNRYSAPRIAELTIHGRRLKSFISEPAPLLAVGVEVGPQKSSRA